MTPVSHDQLGGRPSPSRAMRSGRGPGRALPNQMRRVDRHGADPRMRGEG